MYSDTPALQRAKFIFMQADLEAAVNVEKWIVAATVGDGAGRVGEGARSGCRDVTTVTGASGGLARSFSPASLNPRLILRSMPIC